jgi:hypothetical protein
MKICHVYDHAKRRAAEYPPIVDALDALYWQAKGDPSKWAAYVAKIDAIKAKYPIPTAAQLAAATPPAPPKALVYPKSTPPPVVAPKAFVAPPAPTAPVRHATPWMLAPGERMPTVAAASTPPSLAPEADPAPPTATP